MRVPSFEHDESMRMIAEGGRFDCRPPGPHRISHCIGGESERIVTPRDIDRLDENVDVPGARHAERPCILVAERQRHARALAAAKRFLGELHGARVDATANGDRPDDRAMVIDPHGFAETAYRAAGRRNQRDDRGPTSLLAQLGDSVGRQSHR